MKLERKWARLTLVFLLMTLLSLGELLLTQGQLFMVVVCVAQVVLFFIAATAVQLIGLRCPHCGKTACPPRLALCSFSPVWGPCL